ncbi:hypothetical protein [Polycladidibacter hongkongensis]|uniref:hypothetical protein n=1 Tax=Polycladidibacter hongkongensis TaxID=1647556 RepID=UPI00082BB83B|nr:hypothetical protein [Pseudovibrio hongkongensis]
MLLALDLGTKAGWARWEPGLPKPIAGTEIVDDKDFGRRARDWRAFLIRKIEHFSVEKVACEQFLTGMSGKKSNYSAEVWTPAMHVITREVCVTCNVEFHYIPMQTWRKHFLGRGQAPRGTRNSRIWFKEQAKQRCKLLGWSAKDDNAAEALGILDYFRAVNRPAYAAQTTDLFSAGAEK